MNVLLYALGGGWGHLSRAAALAQQLLPAASQVRILSSSPYAPIVQAALPELSIAHVSNKAQSLQIVSETPWDLLVVDTFPRGLLGELPPILSDPARTSVLIHRDLSPEYVAWAGGLRDFVEQHYDLLICPGEPAPFADLPQARLTPPWLVRNPLPVNNPAPVIVCASGNQDELPWYGEAARLVAQHSRVRCIAPALPPGCPPELWLQHWPALDYIASAHVVIGGAGYHTVNECLATQTPLIARPWPRKYDRQNERAQRHPQQITIVSTPAEAAHAAAHFVSVSPRRTAALVNGAAIAAQWIL